jgi:uncharacterized C2H2 Zn-finger protein
MKWTIKLVVEVVPGSPVEHEVGSINRTEEVSPATVGLTIAEGKALLASLQSQMVTEQIQRYVARVKACPECGKVFRTKGYYRSTLRSVYGKVGMCIRRLRRCPCSGSDAASFSTLFTNKSPITPELRYLTAKMAALLPFRKVTDFLGELLPLSAQSAASTVRNRTMKVGKRLKKSAELLALLRRAGPANNWLSASMVGTSGIGTSDRNGTLRSLPARRWMVTGMPHALPLYATEVPRR